MIRMVVKSRVGEDGVLHLEVPLGATEANREVQLTIETTPADSMALEERRKQIAELAGSWQGDFERPKQGELEERDAL